MCRVSRVARARVSRGDARGRFARARPHTAVAVACTHVVISKSATAHCTAKRGREELSSEPPQVRVVAFDVGVSCLMSSGAELQAPARQGPGARVKARANCLVGCLGAAATEGQRSGSRRKQASQAPARGDNVLPWIQGREAAIEPSSSQARSISQTRPCPTQPIIRHQRINPKSIGQWVRCHFSELSFRIPVIVATRKPFPGRACFLKSANCARRI